MDSKVVTRLIRKEVWPVLKRHGFDAFAGRSAWRHSAEKIDVVNFQSFNSYLAAGVGCTSFSFALNLGCFLTFLPFQINSAAQKDGVLVPHEYECHLRRRLQKSIKQPELSRTDTWFIGPNGEYLAETISDAANQIQSVGLLWFQRFSDVGGLIRNLQEEEGDSTFMPGSKESPLRLALLGAAEIHHHNQEVGIEHLRAAVAKLSGRSTPLKAAIESYLAESQAR